MAAGVRGMMAGLEGQGAGPVAFPTAEILKEDPEERPEACSGSSGCHPQGPRPRCHHPHVLHSCQTMQRLVGASKRWEAKIQTGTGEQGEAFSKLADAQQGEGQDPVHPDLVAFELKMA